MSSPTFPLATLAPTINAAGITAPSFNSILSSLIASAQSIFGSDILLTPDTQDYQMLAIIALAISDTCQRIIDTYNNYAPSFAQGAGLSALVKINGLQRLVPTNSTVLLNIGGVATTTKIFGGVVQDNNGNLWNLPAVVQIPGSGSIQVTATCQTLGAITAPAGSTTYTISTPTLGWQTVTPAADAVPGAPVETDFALRIRQALSVSLPAQTPLSSIAAAIANLPGVLRSIVYENSGTTSDTNGAPAHSIYAVVQGGSLAAIAQTIEAKKSPGTATFGSTSVTVNDPSGVPITINFYQLALTNIFVNVTIKALSTFVSSTQTAIVNALIAAITSLPIGSQVYYNTLISVAGLGGSAQFHITALTSGTAASPTGTVDIAVAFNAAAFTDVTKINVTVT